MALALAEGIETGLAVAKMRPGAAVWSLVSAGNFKNFSRPAGVEHVEVWGDNDESFTGQAAAYGLANRLAMSGISVVCFIPSKPGTDWADQQEV